MAAIFIYLISRSKSSSSASPDLLSQLIASLAGRLIPIKLEVVRTSFLTINNPFKLLTASFKTIATLPLLRDLRLFFSFVCFIVRNNKSVIFLYNPTRLLFFLIGVSYLLLPLSFRIVLIHADGKPYNLKFLKQDSLVICFSEVMFRFYKYRFPELIFELAYPCLSNNFCRPVPLSSFSYDSDFGEIILHSGSFSDYNTPLQNLKFLAQLSIRFPLYTFVFTTSQSFVGQEFYLELDKFRNFKVFSALSSMSLQKLFHNASIFLDLRQTKNLSIHQHGDTPSKLFQYLPYQKPIFSTRSFSIPKHVRRSLYPLQGLGAYLEARASGLPKPVISDCFNKFFLDQIIRKWL